MKKDTSQQTYTKRLQKLQGKKWKEKLDVQRPYRWNIRRLKLGNTLDIGCGIGRNLENLNKNSVGLDHNLHSIKVSKSKGLLAFTPNQFKKSPYNKKGSFDSILLAHVIEHLKPVEAKQIISEYLPYLKKNGRVVIICPQEKGFSSDETHVTFFNAQSIASLLKSLGLSIEKTYSFPFTASAGKIFTYNETIVIGSIAILS